MNKNNTLLSLDILKSPLITDKTSQLLETNEYVFLVDKKATKPIIKKSSATIISGQYFINTNEYATSKKTQGWYKVRGTSYL